MPGVFAVPADVEARWRTLTPDERSRAAVLLEDASDMIRSRFPDVDSRLASGALRDSTLERITAGVVKRAMSVGDQEGVASAQQTAGPYTTTSTYANPNANLYLSREDLRALSGTPRRRAFAVDL